MNLNRRDFLAGIAGAGLGFFVPKSVQTIFDIQNNPVPAGLSAQQILRQFEHSLLTIQEYHPRDIQMSMCRKDYEKVNAYLKGLFGYTNDGIMYRSSGVGQVEIRPTDGLNKIESKVRLAGDRPAFDTTFVGRPITVLHENGFTYVK